MDVEAEIFKFVAGIDILMVMYIIYKINQDDYKHVYSKDALWISRARNLGFLMMGFMLSNAIWNDGSRSSILWLFYSASYSIYVNVLALYFRE